MSANHERDVHRRLSVIVRAFLDEDYPRFAEINNLSYPDAHQSVEEIRYRDDTWDHARYVRERVVAETTGGLVIGSGRINHIPDEFHPLKYSMHLAVDPAFRRRGVGAALYESLLAIRHTIGRSGDREALRSLQSLHGRFAQCPA